ncbi:HAD family hydrolase [Parasediminibacterium sp. JCM 36343]|uniref:HAD family hydrolase n=1 Tax=Parasediminibacterium sp. JCM 36343 TaxID=3374279 RepID=UPI00397CDCDE
MDYRQFKHISFDLWLTLIQSNPYHKQKRNELLIDFFNIDAELSVVSATYSKFDKLFNKVNEITGRNLDAYELWLIFLNDLQVDIKKISKAQIDAFVAATEKLFFEYPPVLIEPSTPHIFKRLVAEGHTLSLLCNTAFTTSVFLRKLLDQLHISPYFSFQLYSDEMQYSKPSPQVYERMFQEVSKIKTITKKDILHIGDNEFADLMGATNFGIAGKLLQPGQGIGHLF